jgi:hypothetical protein
MIMATRFYLISLVTAILSMVGAVAPAVARVVPEGNIAGSGCVAPTQTAQPRVGDTLVYFIPQNKLEKPWSYNDYGINVTSIDLPSGSDVEDNKAFFLGGAIAQKTPLGFLVEIKYDKLVEGVPELGVKGKGTYNYTFYSITSDYPHIGKPFELKERDFVGRLTWGELRAICAK